MDVQFQNSFTHQYLCKFKETLKIEVVCSVIYNESKLASLILPVSGYTVWVRIRSYRA